MAALAQENVVTIKCSPEYWSLVNAQRRRVTEDKSLMDLTIRARGGALQCHKLVLALHSPVMEELLSNTPGADTMEVDSVGVEIMQILLDYMYLFGKVQMYEFQLLDTIIVSDYFKITPLKNECLRQFLPTLHTDNVILHYTKAHRNKIKEVQEACEKIILANLKTIMKQEDFRQMEYSALKDFLDKNRHMIGRTLLLDAAVSWVSIDAKSRIEYTKELTAFQSTPA